MSLPKEAYVITEKYILRMNELLKAELAWDKMEDYYINLYASVFSEKELRELVHLPLVRRWWKRILASYARSCSLAKVV